MFKVLGHNKLFFKVSEGVVPFGITRLPRKNYGAVPKVPFHAYGSIRLMKIRGHSPGEAFSELDEGIGTKIKKEWKSLIETYRKSEKLKVKKIKPLEYNYVEPEPYEHQKIGTSLLMINKAYCLFCEQGTGKTRMTIDALCNLKDVKNVIIAAPLSVLDSGWVGDLEKFATRPFNLFRAYKGTTRQKIREIKDWVQIGGAPIEGNPMNILLVGYDYFWRLFPHLNIDKYIKKASEAEEAKIKKFVAAFRALLNKLKLEEAQDLIRREIQKGIEYKHYKECLYDAFLLTKILNRVDTIVMDESQKIKNFTAKRTKAFLLSCLFANRKYLLSGTPYLNSASDLYGQFSAINPFFFPSKKAFVERYIVTKDVGNHIKKEIKIRDDKIKELNAVVNGVSFIVKKEDVLKDLPDKIFVVRDIYLKPKTTRIYKQIRDEAIAIVESIESHYDEMNQRERIVATGNVFSKLIKLNQITSGFLIESEEENPYGIREAFPIGDEKLKETLEILESIGDKKAVIWANFTFEIDRLEKEIRKAGYKVDKIYGGTPIDKREKIIRNFQEGDLQVIVANPTTLGSGVTLTAAHHCIYYSLTFKLEDFLQSQDRLHRIGQKNNVTYYILLSVLSDEPDTRKAKETIDRKIYYALKHKRAIANEIVKFAVELFQPGVND